MTERKQWYPDFERDPLKFYAGDLRAMGIAVPDSIPDCASVPRVSIRYGKLQITADPDNRTIRGTIPMEFTEPFTWCTVDVTIPKEDG